VQARAFLAEGERLNPGPWVKHSVVAGEAAAAIARHHPALEPDVAYVMGLLHDIGRSRAKPGGADVRHILDGYYLLRDAGFDDVARICLTHSFPIKNVDAFASAWECPESEQEFVQEYLDQTEYSSYDRLIQLCDALALTTGPCLVEKRLVDVALRHGFNGLTLDKWRAYLTTLEQMEHAIGRSVYSVLPGVVEGTFGFTPADTVKQADRLT
jgi:hypothetical protein